MVGEKKGKWGIWGTAKMEESVVGTSYGYDYAGAACQNLGRCEWHHEERLEWEAFLEEDAEDAAMEEKGGDGGFIPLATFI